MEQDLGLWCRQLDSSPEREALCRAGCTSFYSHHLFSSSFWRGGESSLYPYQKAWGYRVVAGLPLATFDSRLLSRKNFEKTIFFGVTPSDLDRFGAGWSAVELGLFPLWYPSSWNLESRRCREVRKQKNRALNKGVRLLVPCCYRDLSLERRGELGELLRFWQEERAMPPMSFVASCHLEDFARDRLLFIATLSDRVVAFLVVSRSPLGWYGENLVVSSWAPNGTASLLFSQAIQEAKKEKVERLTLGLSPLAPFSQRVVCEGFQRRWVEKIKSWFWHHGERWYRFQGLARFKSKLAPDKVEPHYMVVPRGRELFSLFVLLRVFAGRSLTFYLASYFRRWVNKFNPFEKRGYLKF